MKTKTLILAGILGAALAMAAGQTNAALIVGDVIVIDFGKDTDETSGNWNNISRPTSSPDNYFGADGTLDASLNRFSDNAETGVSLSVTAASDANTGIGGLTATAGAPSFSSFGLIPDSAQEDVAFVNDDSVTFTFGGLNDSLRYNIELLSRVDVATHPRNSTDVTIGGTTKTIDPNDGLVHGFYALPSVGGEITISFSGTGNGSDLFHINALELTVAVPEPSSLALLGAGGAILMAVRVRRSRANAA